MSIIAVYRTLRATASLSPRPATRPVSSIRPQSPSRTGKRQRQLGYMSIGENVGRASRVRMAIRRTPIGIYFVTEQLDTSPGLHEKVRRDRLSSRLPERLGSPGRETHRRRYLGARGPDPKVRQRRPERDTDGCIALPNEDLATLLDPLRSTGQRDSRSRDPRNARGCESDPNASTELARGNWTQPSMPQRVAHGSTSDGACSTGTRRVITRWLSAIAGK